jgi:hypothetical protein
MTQVYMIPSIHKNEEGRVLKLEGKNKIPKSF